MNKVSNVVVRFACVFLFCSGTAYAEEELKVYEFDETVVTVTKQEALPEKVPQPVTVITREEVRKSPAYNVGEMLDYVPGVRVISAGTAGASNGISIRSLNGGPSSNKTLVLVDGRPVNEAWSGGVNWHSIPLELVDRVEVVRGPGSALYGSQASGGVINVLTKKPGPGFNGWFTVGHEMNSSEAIDNTNADGYGRPEISATRIGMNGSFGGAKTSHFLSLGYRNANQSFPTPDENKWDNFDIMYKGSHDFSDALTSRFTLDIHNNSWDNKADWTPAEDVDDNISADFSTMWLKGRGVFNGRLYLNYAKNDNTVYSSDLRTGSTSNRIGVITDYSLPVFDASMLVFGLDAFFDNADVDYEKTVVDMNYRGIGTVNALNRQTGAVYQVQAETYEGTYGSNSQPYNEHNVALFAQYSHRLIEKMDVVIGGRLDTHSEFGSIFNPKAGLTYELFKREGYTTNLKINYGTAFRAPPMWGLFSQSLDGYGNLDLKPEKTKNTDVGIFQRFGSLGYTEITFFHMDVTDLLINDKLGTTGDGYYVFVPTESGIDTTSFNQRMNLGDYSPRGVEFGFKIRPHRQLAVQGVYTYLDPGDFTFQTSRHRYNVGLNGYIPFGKFRVEGDVRYNHTGDGYFFDYEAQPFDAFGITEGRITLAFNDTYRISLHAKNLTDTKYRLWHYYWQPGRTFMISFESMF